MRKLLIQSNVLTSGVTLSACSSMSGSGHSGDGSSSYGNSARGSGASAYGTGGRSPFVGQSMQSQALLEKTIFHFGFDQDSIEQIDLNAIAAHGKYLAKHPGAKVTLEGHTDQRGSREYNIGVGERRDKSVEQILLLNGAKTNQIKLVSYGQEKPVAFGHTKQAYAKNRRVEIVIQQGEPYVVDQNGVNQKSAASSGSSVVNMSLTKDTPKAETKTQKKGASKKGGKEKAVTTIAKPKAVNESTAKQTVVSNRQATTSKAKISKNKISKPETASVKESTTANTATLSGGSASTAVSKP